MSISDQKLREVLALGAGRSWEGFSMKAWWRDKELTDEEAGLLTMLFTAHHKSAFRENASTVAVITAADASGDLCKAFSAGLMTLGLNHAPIEQTVNFLLLAYPPRYVEDILKSGKRVPGWGGTFQREQPDPIWSDVSLELMTMAPDLHAKISDVTVELGRLGKDIYPNPSAYTAAAAIRVGMPAKIAPYLFIAGRAAAWAQIAASKIIHQRGAVKPSDTEHS